MSRIGQKPVTIPAGVKVTLSEGKIVVGGQFGTLQWTLAGFAVSVLIVDGSLKVVRHDDSARSKAVHGLTRALISNMVQGVSSRFEKRLELQGVGYQASLLAGQLSLNVGFSHPVVLAVPTGVECVLIDPTHLLVRGADRALVGQFSANIRNVRPPEPYKGKGIRYANEFVRRKSGKAFGSK